jgi:hypothetical protein
MVIAEAIKFRLNKGKRPNIFFYRDSAGNEVDMIYELGQDLFPIEIKAGATITGDYFRGLNSFMKMGSRTPLGGGLIYGGDEVQLRTDFMVYPATKVHEMMSVVERRQEG